MLLAQADLVQQFKHPGADLFAGQHMVGHQGFRHDLLHLKARAERREWVLEDNLHLLAHAPHFFLL